MAVPWVRLNSRGLLPPEVALSVHTSFKLMYPPRMELVRFTVVLLELTAFETFLISVKFCSHVNMIIKIHFNITRQ
jgi:hypothetical protein